MWQLCSISGKGFHHLDGRPKGRRRVGGASYEESQGSDASLGGFARNAESGQGEVTSLQPTKGVTGSASPSRKQHVISPRGGPTRAPQDPHGLDERRPTSSRVGAKRTTPPQDPAPSSGPTLRPRTGTCSQRDPPHLVQILVTAGPQAGRILPRTRHETSISSLRPHQPGTIHLNGECPHSSSPRKAAGRRASHSDSGDLVEFGRVWLARTTPVARRARLRLWRSACAWCASSFPQHSRRGERGANHRRPL